jgi:antitoxin (DNA-binding transcriptional repressor) of toxin-antitoxin stability system
MELSRRLTEMTSSGHVVTMKRVRVAQLKTHLSAYLADIRGGESMVVCDRNTPIARLVPYDEHPDGLVIREPRRPGEDLRKIRGVKPRRAVDVVRLLRVSRDQR